MKIINFFNSIRSVCQSIRKSHSWNHDLVGAINNDTAPVFELLEPKLLLSADFVFSAGADTAWLSNRQSVIEMPSRCIDNNPGPSLAVQPTAPIASISGHIFRDYNNNGLQDVDDPGIDGAEVQLYLDNGDGIFNFAVDTIQHVVLTAADGSYSFTALEPGTYWVDVDETAPTTNNIALAGNTDALMIPLSDGQHVNNADMGYISPWTVMVFVIADNDLERYALNEFVNNMATVGSNENLNILVQMDRHDTHDTRYDDWTDTHRGRVELGDTPGLAWGTSLGEIDTGDPAALTDFITWGTSNYVADNYAVILWDHGAGLNGFGLEGHNPDAPGSLTLQECRSALEPFAGEIDIFGLDGCIMGLLENAYEVRNVADFFIASQKIGYANVMFPYSDMYTEIRNNPYITPEELSIFTVDEYQPDAAWFNGTLSATNLERLRTTGPDSFMTRLNDFATTVINDATIDDLRILHTIRPTAYHSYSHNPAFIDLGWFLDTVIANAGISASIINAATELRDAYNIDLNHRIITHTCVMTGLNIYFPEDCSIPVSYTLQNDLQFLTNAQNTWDNMINYIGSLNRIHGSVYEDLSRNGVWDPNEGHFYMNANPISGIPDLIPVQLYDDDGDGTFEPGYGDNLLATVHVDWSVDLYVFPFLEPGDYWVNLDMNSPRILGMMPVNGDADRLVHVTGPDQIHSVNYALAPNTIIVDDFSSDIDDGNYSAGNLTLREAVNIALDHDKIIFDTGAPTTVVLSLDEFFISGKHIIIDATGSDITIDADNSGRAFNIDSGASLKLIGLDIINGYHSDGGAIRNSGELYLDRVRIADSISPYAFGGSAGGGIYNSGSAMINNSTIENNNATGSWNAGGGIANTGYLSISNSTIAHNEALYGGGIYNMTSQAYQQFTMTNTTISGNTSIQQGGGIYNSQGLMTLVNCTVAFNTADPYQSSGNYIDGGGIYSNDAVNYPTIHNTIIADNVHGDGSGDQWADDVYGNYNPYSTCNFIGNIDESNGLDGNGTLYGSLDFLYEALDPKLFALADNGGPTQTHALFYTSRAIDHGSNSRADNADLITDQRGIYKRICAGLPVGPGNVDIGAFEYDADYIVTTYDGGNDPSKLDLQEAIDLANADPDQDYIYINDGLGQIRFGTPMSRYLITTDIRIIGLGNDLFTIKLVNTTAL